MFTGSSEYKSDSYLYSLSIIANLGSLYIGFFFVSFNACEPEDEIVFTWNLNSDQTQIAYISAAIPFGAIFGAIIAAILGYRIGRRLVIMISDIVCLIGIGFTMSNQLAIFIVGRLITGIACGMNYNVIPLFVREISPPEISGRTTGFFKNLWCVGMLIAFLEALALPTGDEAGNYWKIIMFHVHYYI